MIIDFTKLAELIPTVKSGEKEELGSISLVVKKTPKGLAVIYAPKIKGKENDASFAPIVLSGTEEELTTEFDSLTETAKLLSEVAGLNPGATIAKKNTTIAKTIEKAKAAKTKTEVKPVPITTQEKTKEKTNTLFEQPPAEELRSEAVTEEEAEEEKEEVAA